jgi:hypothetical protein
LPPPDFCASGEFDWHRSELAAGRVRVAAATGPDWRFQEKPIRLFQKNQMFA